MRILTNEIATYERRRGELLSRHPGKFVLIRGSDVLVFPDREAATRRGHELFGVEPFLVRRIEKPRAPVVASQWITLARE